MGLFSKIKSALSKTSNKLSSIKDIFTKKKIDQSSIDELSDILITSDFGSNTTFKIISELKKLRFEKESSTEDFITSLKSIIKNILIKSSSKINLNQDKLQVILFCGVNGNGKTTSIAKFANLLQTKFNKKVAMAACDTFRAAAVEQLKTWADRISCEVISSNEGSEPASVAYKAMEYCYKNNIDILLIDTAGRLQNKINLMDELKKIIKVIKKHDETAPHETILTLDATTGQNLFSQIEKFSESAKITGLIVNKLDGTAKGGAIVGIADTYSIPIYFIGTGEKINDIEEFDHEEFANSLFE